MASQTQRRSASLGKTLAFCALVLGALLLFAITIVEKRSLDTSIADEPTSYEMLP